MGCNFTNGERHSLCMYVYMRSKRTRIKNTYVYINIVYMRSKRTRIKNTYVYINIDVVFILSRHFLSQKHLHKSTSSRVENECCCPRTVNIPNVNFTLNKYINIYSHRVSGRDHRSAGGNTSSNPSHFSSKKMAVF